MNKTIILFSSILLGISSRSLAQEKDSLLSKDRAVTLSFKGFVDAFYAFDFNQPSTNFRQSFLYNHNRHNEFNVNLALIQLKAEHARYRANIGLHAGTYASDNYAAEPLMYRFIHEANVGVRLTRKHNVWLDAGVFPSHLGFESAVSTENLTLTRSLLAENSPYFLSGAMLSLRKKKWLFGVNVTNGWQRIQRVSGNSMLSFGTQVQYENATNLTLNWSTFIGTDDPDIVRRIRLFNNFYGKWSLQKWDFIAGLDIGLQQTSKGSATYHHWFSPVLISRYHFSDQWKASIRIENYTDEDEVIITPPIGHGFNVLGGSLGVDYLLNEKVYLRLEGRTFVANDPIFVRSNNLVSDNACVISSIAIKL